MNEHNSFVRVSRENRKALTALPQTRSKTPGVLASLIVLLIAGFLAKTFFMSEKYEGSTPSKSATAQKVRIQLPNELTSLPPPDLLRPLTPEEAVVANAAKPLLPRSDALPARFKLSGDAASKGRALECLTQAIYYEAASEGVEGGKAVAQVVLNRVRHPGYPSSVCGVVFQNSDRTTGCQFSFTCDGSLARIPVAYIWARSRVIASEALSGRVFAPVGHATHYHADYVLPYWADSLDKIAVIGHHIFYRLRGNSGSKTFFSQRYTANEPMPGAAPLSEMLKQALAEVPGGSAITPLAAPPRVEEDRVKALEKVARDETRTKLPLVADLARGQLILEEHGLSGKPKARSPDECVSRAVGRVKPISAEDLRANLSKQLC